MERTEQKIKKLKVPLSDGSDNPKTRADFTVEVIQYVEDENGVEFVVKRELIPQFGVTEIELANALRKEIKDLQDKLAIVIKARPAPPKKKR